MRVRTKTLPLPKDRSEACWNGAALGVVQANSICLPALFSTFWLTGWPWFGLVFFGAWVFVVTLWWKAYDLAFLIRYALPGEEP